MKKKLTKNNACNTSAIFHPINNSSKNETNGLRLSGRSLYVAALLLVMLTFFTGGLNAQNITFFSPESGPVGTTVAIGGSGFNTTPANNIVFFGAAMGTVVSSTSTALAVTVPAGANYNYITVTNLGTNLTAYSSRPFIITFPGSCKPEFAENIDFNTGSKSDHVKITDFNSDGKSDLAVTHYDNNTVSIFRNTSTMGSVSFAAKVDFATGLKPKEVETGDLDGDGKPDIVVEDSSSVSIFLNTSTSGNINFAPRIDLNTVFNIISISIGDIDDDGKSDLVISYQDSVNISVFRNTSSAGNISFATKINIGTGRQYENICMGDIDGDGKTDIAVTDFFNYSVSIFRNLSTAGNIMFAAKIDLDSIDYPGSVKFGDIDGDGKIDLIVSSGFFDKYIFAFRNISSSGIINFENEKKFYVLIGADITCLGDLDGDGKPDIIYRSYQHNEILTLRNNSIPGNISFSGRINLTILAGSGYSLSIGDLDGDSKPDLALDNDFLVSILRNTATPSVIQTNLLGNGNSIPNGSVTPGLNNHTDFSFVAAGENLIRTFTFKNTATDSLTVSDITMTGANAGSFTPGSLTPAGKIPPGDSAKFTVNFSPGTTGLKTATVNIFSNNDCSVNQTYNFAVQGTGVITPVVTTFSPESGPVGTSVNITGNGFNTTPANNIVFFGAVMGTVTSAASTALTVTVPAGANYQYISVTNLGNNLTAYSMRPFIVTFPGSCKPEFAAKVDFSAEIIPYDFKTNDIDGDGKPDIVFIRDSRFISVFRNTSASGTVSFAPVFVIDSAFFFDNIEIGDIDGDGKPDMVVADDLVLFKIYVFRNTSSSGIISFSQKVIVNTPINEYKDNISLNDIDGDGKPDIAFNYSNQVAILRNTSTAGSINFASRTNYSTNISYFFTFGDIDGDSKPEMITSNAGNSISVFHNSSASGLISFDPKIDFTVGSDPKSICIGDLDGDGKPDLSVANHTSSNVSVLRNISIGATINFEAKVDFATGGVSPTSLSIGDLDGNGKPDLAVVNYFSNFVTVFSNTSATGLISFDDKVDFTVNGPSYVSIGDLDGDGKPEMSVTDRNSNSISVFRNTATPSVILKDLFGNGNSIPNGSVTPSVTNHTDFAFVAGTGNSARTFTIKNTGADSLTLSSITITGADSVLFTSGSLTPAGKIAPGDSAKFNVSFAPASLGIKTAAVVLNSTNDCIQQTYSFAVKGTGVIKPDITSFTPESGPAGTSVTISGSGFNTTPANNVVFFGAAMASVTSATSTSLSVVVPAGANFNYITVTNLENNLSAYTSKPFVVTFPGDCKPEFAAKVDFGSGVNPFCVCIGDIDGDGKPDMASANSASNSMSVFRNTSSAGTVSFAAKVDFVTGTQPYFITTGDIDGDGKNDVLVTNSSANTISIFRNTSLSGSITFAPKIDLPVLNGALFLSIGDLDGDGKPEIAVSNYTNNFISIIRNTSSSGIISFNGVINLTTGSNPASICINDFNNDNKPDLAVIVESVSFLGDANISIFRNNSAAGNLSFTAGVNLSIGTNTFSEYLSTGDLDGDSKSDLITTNGEVNKVSVFRNTSAGGGTINFTARTNFTAGSFPSSVSIGDLDGDGKPDMVVGDLTSDSISTVRNTSSPGNISFASGVIFASSLNPSFVTTGDLDGDGKPEIAAANSGSNSISVLRNTATLSLIQTNASGNGISIPNGSLIPDIANHTDFDLVNTNENLIRTFTFKNNGTDSLTADSISMSGSNAALFAPGSFTPSGNIAPGDSTTFTITFAPGTSGLKTATVNIFSGNDCLQQQTYSFAVKGTGINAPVITSFTPESGPVTTTVTISGSGFNTTAANNVLFFGAVMAPVTSSTSTTLTAAVPAGANYNLISVTNLENNLTGYSSKPFMITFTGSCKPEFAPKVDFAGGTTPHTVCTGDLDGDGKSDLAVTNENSNFVSVFRNTSTGGLVSFAPKAEFPTGTGPYTVIMSDIDGDGKTDLAVANTGNSTLSVLRNTSTTGNISFASKVDFATGTNPFSVSSGDINADGKPDLAITNNSSNNVSLLRNTSTAGNISFAPKVDLATGIGPYSVSIGDLDGDGKSDMAVANTVSNNISVFRSTSTTGSISFVAKVDFTSGIQPTSVVIGDLDGDGKNDMSAANSSSNSVSVFRNTSVTGTISFSAKVDLPAGSRPFSLSLGDFDGDGKSDIAVTNETSSTVSVFENRSTSGTVSFAGKADFPAGTLPSYLSAGDLDGDGKPEMTVANSGSGSISVFRNTASMSQILSDVTGNGVSIPNGSLIPTITNHTDFGVSVVGGNIIRTFKLKNNATDSLTVSSITITGVNAGSFSQGVLTPSGKIAPGDSAEFTVTFSAVTSGSKAATINIFSNNDCSQQQTYSYAIQGTGSVIAVSSFSPESGPSGTSVIINGIGFNTTPASNVVFFGAVMASVTSSSATSITVTVPVGADYKNISVTNLANNLTAFSSKPFNVTYSGGCKSSFAAGVSFATGSNSFTVGSCDLDGDGKSDIAAANRSSNNVSVFRNTSTAGTVSFEAKVDYPAGSQAIFVTFGDLDGDGKPDMVVANYTGFSVSVYRNTSTTGTISFAAKVDYGTGPNCSSASIGDLDGDGKPEIACGHQSISTVSVLRNTSTVGMISFAVRVNFPAGQSPAVIQIADIDGDGKSDMTFANQIHDNMSVIRNTSTEGTISFAPRVNFASGDSPGFVSIGDIDADGKPDVAVAINSEAMVSVFRNTSTAGSVSFASRVNYGSGNQPISIGMGDIDGDGKPDMAIANVTGGIVSVYHNTSPAGSISFDPKSDFTAGPGCKSVLIGDIDNDGRPDLASVLGSSFTVLLNSGAFQTNLTGNGNSIPNGSVLPDLSNHTDFGNNTVRTFTFQNNGDDSIEVNSISMTGEDSASFTPGSLTPPGKIAPGEAAAFSLTFVSAHPGLSSATVNIISTNACNQQTYSFAVKSGSGSGTVNIKVIPEGFYNAGTDKLNMRDTVRAYLCSNISPFNIIDSSLAVIDSITFTGAFTFANAPAGTYYIRINHRNTTETWSKSGGEIFTPGSSMNYDFTAFGSQAFGNNMKQVGTSPVRYAIFSGDIDQNNFIELNDIILAYNSNAVFGSGYISTDVNGDMITDLSDIIMTYNNSAGFVSVVKP